MKWSKIGDKVRLVDGKMYLLKTDAYFLDNYVIGEWYEEHSAWCVQDRDGEEYFAVLGGDVTQYTPIEEPKL